MASKKIAFEVEIKNVTKVTKLKEELKKLRKQQRLIEKDTAKNTKAGRLSSKQYDKNSKAIAGKSKKLRELNKEMRTGTTATKKATKSNNGMAKQFVKGAAAIAVVVGAFRAVSRILNSVVSVFTEFEFVMAKVNAVSGATEREFVALNETAEELGRTTFFTAAQVGELMLNFSKLGFTASEIQDAVQPTLDLATATGSDLARAALVAGAAVRGFGLDASETQRVVDVMAVSFSSSAMNIEKWQTSMTKVAPIAKSAGFSIEDTAAIMSKLTDSGIEASIAGTSLRNILLKMQDPTSELSMRFGKTIHSLDELVPAMKKFVAEGGSMADVMEVVDLRQAAAFEQMITTADGTLELRDALLAAGGEGARMAGIVGDTLQGAFLKFTSAIQGLSISLTKNYSGGMQKAVEATAKWMNKLALNVDKVVALIDGIRKIVIGLAAYKIGVVALSVVKKVFTKTTITATAAVNAFGKALARTGVGLLVIALGDLIYSLSTFNTEAEKATDWTEKLEGGIKDEEKSVKELEVSLGRLAKAKETIDKYSKEEVENMDKSSLEYAKYSKQLIIATQETNTLNTAFRENGEELIDLQTDIGDTQQKFSDLAVQMRNTAAVAVASQMSSEVVRMKMTADNVLDDLIAKFKGTKNKLSQIDIWSMAKTMEGFTSFEEWLESTGSNVVSFFTGQKGDWEVVRDAIDDAGISLGDFVKFAGEFSFSGREDSGTRAMEATLDSIMQSIIKINPEFNKLIKLVGEGVPGGGGGDNAVTNWAYEMTLAINAVKQARLDSLLTDEEWVEKFGDIKRTAIKTEREYKDEILQIKADQLATELATLNQTEQLRTRNAKRITEIEKQQLDIQLQQSDSAFATEFNTLKENLNADIQEIKNKYSVEGQVTAEGQEMILNLELIYLNAKLKLHNEYGKQIINGATEIDAKEQTIHDQRLKRFREEIGAMGGVGSAMQTLAGDNEDLSAVKEAGIAISKVATVVEAGLTLATNLQTLASQGKNMAKGAEIALDAQGIVITNTDTASKAANTGGIIANTVATAGAIIKDLIAIPLMATKAILNQGSGDPYSAFFRIIAMIGLITGVLSLFMEKGGLIPTEGKFAKGGMVRGKSHAQGGEKFAVGGRVVELEGGEAVINKRSTAMYKDQLSAMNQAGGGNKFADGGLLNMPSFAATSFNSLNSQRESTQKVIVVESDITRAQQKVNVIEAAATI